MVRYLHAMAGTFDSHDQDGPVTAQDEAVAGYIKSLAHNIADEEHSEFRAENDGAFELIDTLVLLRALDERDEVRDVLAPLLNDPRSSDCACCVFCQTVPGSDHDADCPVLRRDELLGPVE